MSWAVDAGWQYGGGAGGRPGAPQWERDSVTQAVAETVANRSNVPDVTFVEKFSISYVIHSCVRCSTKVLSARLFCPRSVSGTRIQSRIRAE